ncbi:aromatic amino acid transport family protein [Facilibium subflavum]|uniref:aromatic amino acid transport family protein n=1 Tax=Facilibium subflavum TaxID=2219058 RepID=UPI0013C37439|nr:aromatic amino acid transport family protein [Facilibium subflavum]
MKSPITLTKFIGCILLIVSCMIGAGILALPILATQLGLILTSGIIILFYILMCISGLLTLEVSVKLPAFRNHFSSVAYHAFGRSGKYITVIAFGIAIYSSIAAYIAASPQLLISLIKPYTSIKLSATQISFLFTFILGSIVVMGMKHAERINRLIMLVKLGSLIIVITLLSHYISLKSFTSNLQISLLPQGVLVVALAFCYQLLVPSLVNYVGKNNLKTLKKIIIIATTITCLIYLLWAATIVGFINSAAIGKVPIHNLSELINVINQTPNAAFASILIQAFLDVTLFASFLAVSIAFTDFWVDCFELDWKLKGRIIAGLIAFIPPYLAVIFYKGLFINALSISGYFGLLYALFLPAFAAFKTYTPNVENLTGIAGGRKTRAIITLISLIIIIGLLLGLFLM